MSGLFLMTIISFWSCEAIIEDDLTETKIDLLAPSNNYSSLNNSIVFWWEGTGLYNDYQLQVVSPSFSAPERLVLDSITPETKFELKLLPGDYQWRVRALNYSSSSEYSVRSFRIDTSSNISGQRVILTNPSNNDTTNNYLFLFEWEEIIGVETYRLFIEKEGTTEDFEVLETYMEKDLSTWGEGSFNWKVRAENTLSNTMYSEAAFFVDTTSPVSPSLLFPVNNTEYQDSVISFSWERESDGGSRVFDSIFIYQGPTSQLVEKDGSTNMTYEYKFENGTYKWIVRSYDRAGNIGVDNELFTFTINHE
ncbi:MAG: hypothetical protein JEZ03_06380 [Bacteroidales bacterium]|nr:hypothetical protein [Bacteroidales bacterium]